MFFDLCRIISTSLNKFYKEKMCIHKLRVPWYNSSQQKKLSMFGGSFLEPREEISKIISEILVKIEYFGISSLGSRKVTQ